MFNILKYFHVYIERETSKKLKCIDNVREHRGSLEIYYIKHNIKDNS